MEALTVRVKTGMQHLTVRLARRREPYARKKCIGRIGGLIGNYADSEDIGAAVAWQLAMVQGKLVEAY